MTYRFRPGESTASEFSRIVREELDAAIDLVTVSSLALDERVHETRKHVKKLRGLLALGASALDGAELARAKRALRETAHSIAALRGRAALVEAYDVLVEHTSGGLDESFHARIRDALRVSNTPGRAELPALARAAALLGGLRERLRELEPREDGWRAIAPGFRATYARARRAGERARKHPKAEALHRFRTPAKRHYYQVHLLEASFPELLGTERRELARLGDVLGDHHDLFLLARELERCELGGERDHVNALVEQRRKALERAAFALEARLFAEKPRAKARRFARYFAAAKL